MLNLYLRIFNKIKIFVKLLITNPSLIKKFFLYIRKYGFRSVISQIKLKLIKFKESSQKESIKIEYFDFKEIFLSNKISIPSIDLQKPIDIIIPVYNGYNYLTPLFDSIIKNTTLPYRLLICDDKSSDEKVLPLLKEIKEVNSNLNIIVLENEVNLGFIKTVNKLSKFTENHFVLLNTDIELPSYWIERLMYPIFEMENIASTTPFTNSGTICSFPNYLEDNEIYKNLNVNEIDEYFKYIAFDKTYIEIPTGVGFCMGVNKYVVEKIGMFDEVYGKGYGEENDWCQNAIQLGYKNIHVPNLFVYHKHGGSFNVEEKQELQSKNLGILLRRFPTYNEQVQKLIIENKLENLRKEIVLKIDLKLKKLFFLIDHNLGGGANYYVEQLIEEKRKEYVVFLMRYDFFSKEYTIALIDDTIKLNFKIEKIEEIFHWIKDYKIDEIFINSLISYPNIFDMITMIKKLKIISNAQLVIPMHDYFSLCPNYNLLNEQNIFCNIPSNKNICDICLSKNLGEFKLFLKEKKVDLWRDNWLKLLDVSDSILCFSNSSKNIFLKVYSKYAEKVIVKPHILKDKYDKIYFEHKNSNILTIGILGGINEAKGALIVKNIVDYIDANKIKARVVLFGDISIVISSSSFINTGRYKKEELPDIIKKYDVSKFLIPSICSETFSYTTDEIMQMGFPLVVFNIGAPAERVKNYELGMVIEIEDLMSELFEKEEGE